MKQQIDINTTRFPSMLSLPAEMCLDMLDRFPDFPTALGRFDPDNGIEKVALTVRTTDRGRFIEMAKSQMLCTKAVDEHPASGLHRFVDTAEIGTKAD